MGLLIRAFLLLLLVPTAAYAQTAQFAIVSDANIPLNEKVNVVLEAQNSTGEKKPVPQTTCLRAETTSSSGSFFTSSSAEEPHATAVQVTMSKNTSSRTLGYIDTRAGVYELTITAVFRPEEITVSCTNWPVAEWPSGFQAKQTVQVGEIPPSPSASSGTSKTGATSGSGSSGSEYTTVKRHLEELEAGGDRIVAVGAAEFFEAHAHDQFEGELSAITYKWNFGNGVVREGKKVLHQYDYPGTYVVVVTAHAPRDYVAEDRFEVEARPIELVITAVTPQHISIENRSSRDTDLSMWTLRAGAQTFQFPGGTIILAGKTLSFPSAVTKLSTTANSDVALLYPSGRTATRAGGIPTQSRVVSAVPAPARVADASAGSSASDERLVERDSPAPTDSLAAASESVGNSGEKDMLPWLLGLSALLLVTIGSLLVVRSREPESEAAQYKIIDESEKK